MVFKNSDKHLRTLLAKASAAIIEGAVMIDAANAIKIMAVEEDGWFAKEVIHPFYDMVNGVIRSPMKHSDKQEWIQQMISKITT